MPELAFIRNDEELFRIPLQDKEITLGRDEANDVVIQNPKASRRHARILMEDGAWVIKDLGSSNGTFMGEQRISERKFADGDEVRIADHIMVYIEQLGGPVARLSGRLPAPRSMLVGGSQPGRDWELLRSVLVESGSEMEGAKRLQALFEISRTIEEARDFNAVLSQIMDKAITILGAERGFLMLADSETGALKVHVARDRLGDVVGVDRETISRSLMLKVVENRKPVLLRDAQSEEWGTKSVLAHSIHSALCAPLMTGETVSGVLYVDQRQSARAFTTQDLAFFTTFAMQAKAAIDSSRTFWELVDSLFRASDDFIVVCALDGAVRQVNRAAAVLLGRKDSDIVGRKLDDLVAPGDRDRACNLCGETADKIVVSGIELTLLAADGTPIPLHVSSFALRDRTGRAIGLCLIGRDLRELRHLIDSLTLANRDLEVRNDFIRKTFGRYLSDEVVASLLESPDRLALGGEKRTVTILMSDLRGFTGLAERLPPEQVVRILNHYLGTMVDVITRYQGTIDEFIGDAILVIFGAPIQRPDDALRAAACAVEMQIAMAAVNEWTRADSLPELEMGIALNTGDVVVGNIGSLKRSKYAVVGRHVNVTSRIESNTVGGQILVPENTVKKAGDALKTGRRMELRVKGIKGALFVYELLGVEAPYNVLVPDVVESAVVLEAPFQVQYGVLEGKLVGAEDAPADVVRLGAKIAELRADTPPPPLTNIRIRFPASAGAAEYEDVYAKILERPTASPDRFIVRFTSVPPEVKGLIEKLIGQAPRAS